MSLAYVYRIIDVDGVTRYVGSTKSHPEVRLYSHVRRSDEFGVWLRSHVHAIEVIMYVSLGERWVLEDVAIRAAFKEGFPLFNRKQNRKISFSLRRHIVQCLRAGEDCTDLGKRLGVHPGSIWRIGKEEGLVMNRFKPGPRVSGVVAEKGTLPRRSY